MLSDVVARRARATSFAAMQMRTRTSRRGLTRWRGDVVVLRRSHRSASAVFRRRELGARSVSFFCSGMTAGGAGHPHHALATGSLSEASLDHPTSSSHRLVQVPNNRARNEWRSCARPCARREKTASSVRRPERLRYSPPGPCCLPALCRMLRKWRGSSSIVRLIYPSASSPHSSCRGEAVTPRF